MSSGTELTVALDFDSIESAEKLMASLAGLPLIYKVGLELFTIAGPNWVQKISSHGNRVFLDLKLHDIPNTVMKTIKNIERLGVEFTTIHLAAGQKALDLIEENRSSNSKLKILGVSVLTSFKEEDWISTTSLISKLGSARSIHDSVLHYSTVANDHSAVFGMVCSPLEVSEIRKKYPELYLMVPGIRTGGSNPDDQGRVMSPLEASKAGASSIVVGRPIIQAPNPRVVAEEILRSLV